MLWIIFLDQKKRFGMSCIQISGQKKTRSIFREAEHIYLAETKTQVWIYFGTRGIGNITLTVQPPLKLHALVNIATTIQEQTKFYDNIFSDMISNPVEGSI